LTRLLRDCGLHVRRNAYYHLQSDTRNLHATTHNRLAVQTHGSYWMKESSSTHCHAASVRSSPNLSGYCGTLQRRLGAGVRQSSYMPLSSDQQLKINKVEGSLSYIPSPSYCRYLATPRTTPTAMLFSHFLAITLAACVTAMPVDTATVKADRPLYCNIYYFCDSREWLVCPLMRRCC
jgi:hypothetical protein